MGNLLITQPPLMLIRDIEALIVESLLPFV